MSVQYTQAEKILQELVRKRGTDYLREGKYFVNAVREMDGDEKSCTLLGYLVAVNAHVDLLNAEGLSSAMQKIKFIQAVNKVSSKTLISEELAHAACTIFWRGVYGTEPPMAQLPPEKQKRESIAPPPDPDPAPTPAPAPQPRKGIAKVVIGIICALVCVAILAVLLPGRKAPAEFSQKELPVSKKISKLLSAGTEDIYTYHDGSVLEQYFDDRELEVARIYKNKDGSTAYLFTAEYDNNGNVLEHCTFDGKGTLLRTDRYQYNSAGEWTEHMITLENDRTAFREEKNFRPDGSLTLYRKWDSAMNLLVEEAVYQYSEDGGLVSVTYLDGTSEQYSEYQDGVRWQVNLDADGNIVDKIEDHYNAQDVHTDSYFYDAQSRLVSRTQWQHDDQNRLSTRMDYNADGTVTGTWTYLYNDQGQESATYVYNAEGILVEMTEYIYAAGNLEVGSDVTAYEFVGSKTADYEGVGINAASYKTTSREVRRNVESIVGTHIRYLNQSHEDGCTRDNVISYDIMENMVSYASYDEQGRLIAENRYTYNTLGKQIGEDRFYQTFYADGTLRLAQVSQVNAEGDEVGTIKNYDEQGNLISTHKSDKQYDEQGNSREIYHIYGKNEKLTEERITDRKTNGDYLTIGKLFDEGGNVTASWESEEAFDGQGNSVRSYKSYHGGRLDYESMEKKDAKGNSEEISKNYDSDGQLSGMGRTSKICQKDGGYTQTSERKDRQGRIIEKSEYQYDANYKRIAGESVNTFYYHDGRKTVTTYDHNANVIRTEKYDASGKLISVN